MKNTAISKEELEKMIKELKKKRSIKKTGNKYTPRTESGKYIKNGKIRSK